MLGWEVEGLPHLVHESGGVDCDLFAHGPAADQAMPQASVGMGFEGLQSRLETGLHLCCWRQYTMTFGSTDKVLAKCLLMYYRIL